MIEEKLIDAKEITFDWLMDAGDKYGYTSHIDHFRELFSLMKVRTFLECGCGYSTKYFLDNCEKVISVEFKSEGTDLQWINQCREMYKGINNWQAIDYIGSSDFSWACGWQCSNHTDPALINGKYITEMSGFFDSLLKDNIVDVGFVDAGQYIRGDMVELLLQKGVPIVCAHDTNSDDGTDNQLYGWFKIKTVKDYERINVPHAQGTTFWIHKDLKQVIEGLKQYVSNAKYR